MFAAYGGGSISFHLHKRQNSFAVANKWSVNNTWKQGRGNKFFTASAGRNETRSAAVTGCECTHRPGACPLLDSHWRRDAARTRRRGRPRYPPAELFHSEAVPDTPAGPAGHGLRAASLTLPCPADRHRSKRCRPLILSLGEAFSIAIFCMVQEPISSGQTGRIK